MHDNIKYLSPLPQLQDNSYKSRVLQNYCADNGVFFLPPRADEVLLNKQRAELFNLREKLLDILQNIRTS